MKKMNIFFGVMAIFLGFFSVSCNTSTNKESDNKSESASIEVTNLSIDLDDSFVSWQGDMLGIYSHSGVVRISDADLSVHDGKVKGGSFTIDMTSITPTDENYNPEEGRSKEKLVGHLSSLDFFDVSNHPTSTFEITSIEDSSVKGNLTIRGITNEETIENVTVSKEGEEYKITGEMVFDRTRYDAKFQMTVQDMVLSDDISLDIELIAS